MMLTTLISVDRGPAVSLFGVTDGVTGDGRRVGLRALATEVPLSMYFSRCPTPRRRWSSQCARNRPVTIAPRSMPPSARGPRMNPPPTASGATTGCIPGRIISRWRGGGHDADRMP